LDIHFNEAPATTPPQSSNSERRSIGTRSADADELATLHRALRDGEGTNSAVKIAHKYLYRVRKRSGWKSLYREQHPDADMDANWRAASTAQARLSYTSFEPKMADAPESHAYVQAYSNVITAFLKHPYGVAPARLLLLRQLAEGVPLTQTSALAVLEHMPVPLNVVGTLLPSPTPPVVLAATIRSAIQQDILETPEDFRKIIEATLEEGGLRTEPEHWDWSIWASLIAAHVGDFRGAIRTLNEFKKIVSAARKEAIENGQPWPDHRANAIGDAYANVMHLWMTNKLPRSRASMRSQAPALLAADLDALLQPATASPTSDKPPTPEKLGDEVESPAVAAVDTAPALLPPTLPRQFLTAWLNAERFTQTGRHGIIWSAISGQSIEDAVAGHKPPRVVNTPAYLALFKCLKLNPPASYRPLAGIVPIAARAGLLSAVATHPRPDLPLALALVNDCSPPLRPYLNPLYQERRFDTAAAAVIRAARLCSQTQGKQLLAAPYPPFPHQLSDGRPGIKPGEWEWMSKCIEIRVAGLNLRNPITPILPLSSPRGSLVEDDISTPKPTRGNPVVVTHTQTYDYRGPNKANLLKPALNRVFCDAIVSQGWHMGDTREYSKVLQDLVRPVRAMMGPKALNGLL